MEVTENILLERQRYLINLLIENTNKLCKLKKLHINKITGKDELTNINFDINFGGPAIEKSENINANEPLCNKNGTGLHCPKCIDIRLCTEETAKPTTSGTFNTAFKEATIKEAEKNVKEFEEKYKPETINFKSVLNFDSIEDKITKEKKVIEDYIEKIVKTEFDRTSEILKKEQATSLWGFDWLKFADEVTPEYIDKSHKQIIEKNKETSKNIETKQHKVVLAIFDLSDMD